MPLGTDSESGTDRPDAERHWQIIIVAIRGKEMANVWFRFKTETVLQAKVGDMPDTLSPPNTADRSEGR